MARTMIERKMREMDERLRTMPTDEMTAFEREYDEMRCIHWTLLEMHAIIEGGEAREDYETTAAGWHFTEIDDFLDHRLNRVRDAIEYKFRLKDLGLLLGEQEEEE